MRKNRLFFIALAASLGAGCGSTRTQVVGGQAALESFPSPVTEVQVFRGAFLATRGPVSRDGTFLVGIPAGSGYRIVFKGEGDVPLVFPRSAGGLDLRFDIRGADAPFDLGAVRYVGDPSSLTFAFQHAASPSTAPSSPSVASTAAALTESGETGAGEQDGDNVECEDGIDANTGEVCVDDDEEGAVCEADDDDEGEAEEADGDDVECEDGIDPATGMECDGGPAANTDDGEEGGEDEEMEADEGENEQAPTEAAVADHNLPAAVGCDQEEGEHEDGEHEDGEADDTGANEDADKAG